MARSRRRSGRTGGTDDHAADDVDETSPPDSSAAPAGGAKPHSSSSASAKDSAEQNGHANDGTETSGEGEHDVRRREQDRCPACKEDSTQSDWNEEDKESWVRCDACKKWFHWRCAGEGDLEAIGKWFCQPCRDADPKRVITIKPPARKSARKRAQRDYAGLQNSGVEQDANRCLRMLQNKAIKPDTFKRMEGSEVTLEWLESDPTAMREPIVIENPEGLGMEMPKDITVSEIAEILGESTPVEVIDVATQSNVSGWTLGKWAEYFNTPAPKRDKIRNVISLEISGTPLADRVLPPRLVREVDWVEKFWPPTKKGRGHPYPKVQLYCLMGVADAWTDWHIDFAGSSVYYHILRGSKTFYFIRPTPANLAAYERWSGTEMQNHSWLGDLCDEVFKVELHTGNTMMIPTGWIHAVYTPVDTLVFGGNFIHSYNFQTQLRVREIEIATHVPKKFRFPMFVKLCWYAAEKYLRDLKAKEEFPPRVLESLETLADFLVAEARTIERGSESAKRAAKEEVPGDRVKDAPALARELRWRVRAAEGYGSEDEGRAKRKGSHVNGNGNTNGKEAANTNGVGKKRKRGEEEAQAHEAGDVNGTPFMHFKPRQWDSVVAYPAEKEVREVKRARPPHTESDKGKTSWVEAWTAKTDEDAGGEQDDAMEDAKVEVRRDIVVKVRRTAKGLERQRVERVLEEWTWADGDKPTKSDDASPVIPADAATNGNGDTGESVKPRENPLAAVEGGEDVQMAGVSVG